MNNNITELRAADVEQDELAMLEEAVKNLAFGELHDALIFMIETIKDNKNLYMIATY